MPRRTLDVSSSSSMDYDGSRATYRTRSDFDYLMQPESEMQHAPMVFRKSADGYVDAARLPSDPSGEEEKWQIRSLREEICHLHTIRQKACAGTRDSSLRAKVLADLRARAAADPQRLNVMKMHEVEEERCHYFGHLVQKKIGADKCMVPWRSLHEPGALWPSSPKVMFERELYRRGVKDLGGLDAHAGAGDLHEGAVTAWIQWRKLPDAEKAAIVESFATESAKCVESLRLTYSSLQDAAMTQILLEIYLDAQTHEMYELEGVLAELDRDIEHRSALKAALRAKSPGLQEAERAVYGHYSLAMMRRRAIRKVLGGVVHETPDTIDGLIYSYQPRLKREPGDLVYLNYRVSSHEGQTKDEMEDEVIQRLVKGPESDATDVAAKRRLEEVFPQSLVQKISKALAPWTELQLVREHAMLALIPLLPTLSRAQARWLVYASFTGSLYSSISKMACSHPLSNNPLHVECTALQPLPLSVSVMGHTFLLDTSNCTWHDSSLSGLNSNGTQRLFCCALPDTVVDAMCGFVLDEHALSPPSDAEAGDRVFVARSYLARHAIECPKKSHRVHCTLAAMFGRYIQLADPSRTADIAKLERLARLGQKGVDLDFLNRGEASMMVAAVIDCMAHSCIEAVRNVYSNICPNHLMAPYGKQGLLTVLAIMGVGSKLDSKDLSAGLRNHTISYQGKAAQEAARLGVIGDLTNERGLALVDEKIGPSKMLLAESILNSQQSSAPTKSIVCAMCGVSNAQLPSGSRLQLCSRCGLVKYCSVECQRKDYKSHKAVCRAANPVE